MSTSSDLRQYERAAAEYHRREFVSFVWGVLVGVGIAGLLWEALPRMMAGWPL